MVNVDFIWVVVGLMKFFNEISLLLSKFKIFIWMFFIKIVMRLILIWYLFDFYFIINIELLWCCEMNIEEFFKELILINLW